MTTLRPVSLLIALAFSGIALAEPPTETALDRYIAKPEPAYGWKVVKTTSGPGWTGWVLDLTSQTWRSKEEVDRTEWHHWLSIVKPEGATGDTAFIYIGEGDNGEPAPDAPDERPLRVALGAKTIAVELLDVPNQPLYFKDSPKQPRVEDDLIAYSRVKYIVTHDEEWLVRLAMVKSVVQAMTATQEFLGSPEGGGPKPEHFVVSGRSKRGWTTWLTGIVDPRVVAIIPTDIDALNSQKITRHHYEVYGFFSSALNDYVHHGLFPYAIGSEDYAHILSIEDAYSYFNRPKLAEMPKFMVNASGDQYFLPDNSRQYFSELPGEKYVRYVENTKHDCRGTDADESVLAFYNSVAHHTLRPKFSFTVEKDGPIRLTVEDTPAEVNLWQATNPKARDFRLATIGPAYTKTPLAPSGDKTYIASVPKPAEGFTAFYVELVYNSGGPAPFKFTTEVNVIPDILPFKWEDALKKKP